MNVIFEPIAKYIKQITNWLFDEYKKGLIGFYYNFINADFTNNNFVCLVNDRDEAIGFIWYSFADEYSTINVAVVKHTEQKKGNGKLLLDALTEKLISKGTVVLKLFCEPSSSKNRWESLGFKEFKEIENHSFLNSNEFKHPWLYKILVPVKSPTRKRKLETYIELWTDSDDNVSRYNLSSTYKWDAEVMDSSIIYPVDSKWKMKYIKNNIKLFEGQIRWFKGGFHDVGDFLIIDNL